jgi:hypothetical protein
MFHFDSIVESIISEAGIISLHPQQILRRMTELRDEFFKTKDSRKIGSEFVLVYQQYYYIIHKRLDLTDKQREKFMSKATQIRDEMNFFRRILSLRKAMDRNIYKGQIENRYQNLFTSSSLIKNRFLLSQLADVTQEYEDYLEELKNKERKEYTISPQAIEKRNERFRNKLMLTSQKQNEEIKQKENIIKDIRKQLKDKKQIQELDYLQELVFNRIKQSVNHWKSLPPQYLERVLKQKYGLT